MQAAELETDYDSAIPRARAGRAVALIATALLALAATGAAYVHPDLALFRGAAPAAVAVHSSYRVTTIDFVNPDTGWLVVDFPSGNYALIHTTDGGASWTTQLNASSDSHPRYLKFFDASVGVLAPVGTQPVLRRTSDGGETWVARPVLKEAATVLSWSFVDSDHGWMLAAAQTPGELSPAHLYRTEDGGLSWVDLGRPVPDDDQAFQVQFSYLTTGWLTTASSGPYAYRSQDFGATWSRVPLPAPSEGWPPGGQFFVAIRATTGPGLVASVVHFPALAGRSAVGAMIRAYPPLTVRSFDGGRLRTYIYTTVLDQVVMGPFAADSPPNQTQLGTTDDGRTWSSVSLPGPTGAIGYSDAAHWWWIGQGMWASSADAGGTWSEPIDIGVVEPLPGSLQMVDSQHAWFAGGESAHPLLESTDDAGVHWTLSALPALEDRPTAL